MEIESLRLFIQVARRGSFAIVARDRGTDPSSVSRTIAALEDELQVRLLQRSTRRMTLTEAGAAYLARLEPLIEELDHARDEALAVSARPIGTIRLTASVAFGQKCVAPLLPKLRQTCPDLGIDLVLTDANLDLVSEGVDLAIRLGPAKDSSLIGTKLIETQYRACASPAYVAASQKLGRSLKKPNDLTAHNCILLNLPDHRSRWLFRDAEGIITPVGVHGDLLISNPLVLLTCAIDGMGPALLADWLAGDALATGDLVDLFPDCAVAATDFDTAAWLLYPSRTYLPTKVRIVIDFLRNEFGSNSARRALEVRF